MKKYNIILILVCLMFVVGCVSGSYFKVPTDDTAEEESELIKEIQEIEKQLKSLEEDETEEELEVLDEDEECTEECETVCEEVCETDEETDEEVCEEVCEEECTVCEEETEEDEEEIFEEEAVDTSSLEKLEVQETDLINLEIDVEDLDQDTVTYTFSKPLDENGRWQTGYGDAGEYVITITADDGTVSSEKRILLVVEKKNVPPEIQGLEAIMKADEGEVLVLTPKVSDPNKDDVEITFSAPFNELGVWETDHTSAGEYSVTVTASDGEMDTEFKIALTVDDVNVPPAIGNVEELIFVEEGDTVEIDPEVADLDGDNVEVTISEPVGNDGIWETGYTDHGEYVVTVTATDGKDTVTITIDLTVEDVNVPPEIIGVRLG